MDLSLSFLDAGRTPRDRNLYTRLTWTQTAAKQARYRQRRSTRLYKVDDQSYSHVTLPKEIGQLSALEQLSSAFET